MILKGIAIRKTEVRSQPLEDEKYIIGELEQGTEIEINVREFDYYLIKYNGGYAYVKEDRTKKV